MDTDLEFWLGLIVLWLDDRLNHIDRKLNHILDKEYEEMADLTELKAAVADEHDVGQSAIALLTQLTDLVEANATDPAALADIVSSVRADSQALADSVTANTPAAAGGTTGGAEPGPGGDISAGGGVQDNSGQTTTQ